MPSRERQRCRLAVESFGRPSRAGRNQHADHARMPVHRRDVKRRHPFEVIGRLVHVGAPFQKQAR
jgi:hypothetical protein